MSRLKTSWIVMANIALMRAILVFVALYSNYEKKENYRSQAEHFVNASIAMEQVTGNYLEGEQQICDNRAQYINSRDLTLEEAAEYIRATHVKADTSAHLIDTETLTGYSTRPKLNNTDQYDVSYTRMELSGDGSWIAEDNDINWEIISTMLSMFGITSERAENGRICVEKMAEATEGRYDLIFMDVQMPEMNGLDATRHIRKQENRWAASIPIIAMTADAFSENVAECLQAGMNGHIAKPIDLKLVIKEIRRIKEEKK